MLKLPVMSRRNTFRLRLTYLGKSYTTAQVCPDEQAMACSRTISMATTLLIVDVNHVEEIIHNAEDRLQSHLERLPNIGEVLISRTKHGNKGAYFAAYNFHDRSR